MKKSDALAIRVERRIFLIRGQKVMLDFDLAELYGVETRALKQAVRRNLDRFPPDFMFKLSAAEIKNLVSQTVIPTRGKLGGATPMAFSEQGVAMLSSVLRSPRAVQVNIAIMRTFVRLRELLLSNADLARKLAALEDKYDAQFKVVFDAIRELMLPLSQSDRSDFMYANRPDPDTESGNRTDMAEGITHHITDIAERIAEVAK